MTQKTNHYMTTVKVGPKGQIVIPKEIRDMFDIAPEDNLLIMADAERGIAIHKQSVMEGIAKAIFTGQNPALTAREDPQHLPVFAQAITETIEKGEGET